MLGGAIWSLSNAVQWMVPDLTWQMGWNTVIYFGIVIVPTAWFLLAVKFTGYGRKQLEKREGLLWVIPALIYISILTNPFHNLFFTSFELQELSGFVSLQNTFGILVLYPHLLFLYSVVHRPVALSALPCFPTQKLWEASLWFDDWGSRSINWEYLLYLRFITGGVPRPHPDLICDHREQPLPGQSLAVDY